MNAIIWKILVYNSFVLLSKGQKKNQKKITEQITNVVTKVFPYQINKVFEPFLEAFVQHAPPYVLSIGIMD